ncbi:MAG: hypothetical protein LBI33_02965, partial [Propionibacteriaceae bacterium]|nr:hypothetical protein [Propionibacteriaceae bacterium]
MPADKVAIKAKIGGKGAPLAVKSGAAAVACPNTVEAGGKLECWSEYKVTAADLAAGTVSIEATVDGKGLAPVKSAPVESGVAGPTVVELVQATPTASATPEVKVPEGEVVIGDTPTADPTKVPESTPTTPVATPDDGTPSAAETTPSGEETTVPSDEATPALITDTPTGSTPTDTPSESDDADGSGTGSSPVALLGGSPDESSAPSEEGVSSDLPVTGLSEDLSDLGAGLELVGLSDPLPLGLAGEVLTIESVSTTATMNSLDQAVTFTVKVKNTGSVALSGVQLVNLTARMTQRCTPVTLPAASVANPSEAICTLTYYPTQEDIDNGTFTFDASAIGMYLLDGETVVEESGSVKVTADANQKPGLSVVAAVSPSQINAAPDQATFTYTITNTGNVTVKDIALALTQQGNGTWGPLNCTYPDVSGVLALGQSAVCTVLYTSNAADFSQKSDYLHTGITSVASVTGSTAAGSVTAQASAMVNVEDPYVTMSKSAQTTVTLGSDGAATITITYTFVLTAVTNGVIKELGIIDKMFGDGPSPDITCGAGTNGSMQLSQASTTCTATHTVSSSDYGTFIDDYGNLLNVAVAQGTHPNGDPRSALATASTNTVIAHIDLRKSVSPDRVAATGGKVTYTFEVRNTGLVSLENVTINDPDIGLSAAACVGNLPADGVWHTCTAEYMVTPDDLFLDNSFTNHAMASGEYLLATTSGTKSMKVTSQEATATVTADPPTSQLTLSKQSDPGNGGVVQPGGTIIYALTATNGGQVPLTVTIHDDLQDVFNYASLDGGSLSAKINDVAATPPSVAGNNLTWVGFLDPGEQLVITYSVTVKTAAEEPGIYGRSLTNSASGTGQYASSGGFTAVVDPCTDQVCSTTVRTPPSLAVTKYGEFRA